MALSKAKRKHRLNTLFERIGDIAVSWAFLEAGIDGCIYQMHQRWGGKSVMATIPLRSFERKVKYLRGWHSSDTRWQILFPDFDETIDRIERMSSDRHRLIHGAIKNLPEYEDDGFIVLRRTLEMNGDKTTFEEANYNLAAIRGFRRDIVLTATFLGQFASILAGHAD